MRSLCFSEERIVGKWRVKHEKKQDLIGENSWGGKQSWMGPGINVEAGGLTKTMGRKILQ